MDLKTFVTETLCQIQEGVEEAIKRRAESGGGGAINPQYGPFKEQTKDMVREVVFDVAVTATEGESKGVKGGLRVAWVGIGAEGAESRASEVVSRVKFVVPMVVPTTVVEQDLSEHNARIMEQHRQNRPSVY